MIEWKKRRKRREKKVKTEEKNVRGETKKKKGEKNILYTGWSKTKFMMWSRGKVFLSMYSHLLKKLELSKLNRKKVMEL